MPTSRGSGREARALMGEEAYHALISAPPDADPGPPPRGVATGRAAGAEPPSALRDVPPLFPE